MEYEVKNQLENYDELFYHLEPEAFAAASIEQVHHEVLRDGRRVAVKIQYPEIERILLSARFNTPRIDELYARFSRYAPERINRVLAYLVENGTVARLRDDVLFHKDAVREASDIITQAIRERGPIEAAQFRDLVGGSRKYVIPLLEHLDSLGVTRRDGNKRVLRQP